MEIADKIFTGAERRKKTVNVHIVKNADVVFEGTFTCFVLDAHVLTRA